MITIAITNSSNIEGGANTNFTKYKRDITIQNNEASDLVGYQVCIEIADVDFFFKADPNNLVLKDGDNILPYWVETWKRPDGKARIWTKLDLPANSSKTISLYYGGYIDWISQDGDSVFEFFDDFDGSELDTNKWNLSPPAEAGYSIHDSHIEMWCSAAGITCYMSHVQDVEINPAYFVRVKFLPVSWSTSNDRALETYIGNTADDYKVIFMNIKGNVHNIVINRKKAGAWGSETTLYPYADLGEVVFNDFLVDTSGNAHMRFVSPAGNILAQHIYTDMSFACGRLTMGPKTVDGTSCRVLIDYIYISKLTQNEPTIQISSETEMVVYH